MFSAKEGDVFSVDYAFSTITAPFVSPDDLAMGPGKEIYVADGQAETVFKLSHQGGTLIAFVTTATTGSLLNPYGLAFAPNNFDGPNVDPGDLVIADNSYGNEEKAVWAVNPETGVVKVIAQGRVFADGPLKVAFSSDGTLYVFENVFVHGSSRIVILSANGTVTPSCQEFRRASFSQSTREPMRSSLRWWKAKSGEFQSRVAARTSSRRT